MQDSTLAPKKPTVSPFDVRRGRAMVSLGPLAKTKHCTYSCPFCYVNAGFPSYASMSVTEIVKWLRSVQEPFDVIYVSGDTDSFAPPRTDEGLELLGALSEFRRDLLFTTRAVLADRHLQRLARIRSRLLDDAKLLIGCVSVAQLTHPHVEPAPVPPAARRLAQLHSFRQLGLKVVLAMRPFLPIVDTTEYFEIVDQALGGAHVVLGEAWYADQHGVLEKGVFRGPTPGSVEFTRHPMDFDDNLDTWKVYEPGPVIAAVANHCKTRGLPFFMRSPPAIDWLRAATLNDVEAP